MPFCNFSLLIIPILTPSLITLNLIILACMFVLFFKPFDMSIFDFTDGKCSSYVYEAKHLLLSPFQDKAHDETLYHSKCAIFIVIFISHHCL
jgi:hypothetical protein